MKIADHQVTGITQTSAKVGCTRVTIAEAKALVEAMLSAKPVFVEEGYAYDCNGHRSRIGLSTQKYASFTLDTNGEEGWLSAGDAHHFGEHTRAKFCLNRERAGELMVFLQNYFKQYPAQR